MSKNLKLAAIIVLGVLVLATVAYVITRRSNVNTTGTGLKYEDVKVGDGASPKPGQTVRVHYLGRLKDEAGKEFNNSHSGQPIEFSLSQVVPGWQEGLQTMKVGGIRKLWIPSKLAYGAAGRPPSIPPNTDLYFEIELLGIK